jgi:glutathione S-transferase
MSLTLIGSIPSPFVRRIRILLKDHDYDFKVIDLTKNEDQVELLKYSPIRRIPILKDGEDLIYDSRQIQKYLSKKFNLKELSLKNENDLTFLDSVSDSLVSVRLLKSSGFEDNQNTFIRNQYKRIKDTIRYFEKEVTSYEVNESDYVQICLFSLVDWIYYRDLIPMDEFENLKSFNDQFSTFDSAKSSSPRL